MSLKEEVVVAVTMLMEVGAAVVGAVAAGAVRELVVLGFVVMEV
jgi:hypothetical protein